MKKIKLICLLLLATVSIQAQNTVFDKFAKNKNILTIQISKAMLSMIGDASIGDVNIKKFASKLDLLETYTGAKKEDSNQMRLEIAKLVKDKRYEFLMNMNVSEQKITIYVLKKDESTFKEIIMLLGTDDNCTLARLIGNFTLSDLQQIAGNGTMMRK